MVYNDKKTQGTFHGSCTKARIASRQLGNSVITVCGDYKDAFNTLRGSADAAPIAALADGLRALGLVLTGADEEAAKAAAGGGATFNFDQFVAALKKVSGHEQFSTSALTASFMQFDRKDNGFISVADIKYLLSNKLGEPLSDAEVASFIEAIEKKVTKEGNNFNYADVVSVIGQQKAF